MKNFVARVSAVAAAFLIGAAPIALLFVAAPVQATALEIPPYVGLQLDLMWERPAQTAYTPAQALQSDSWFRSKKEIPTYGYESRPLWAKLDLPPSTETRYVELGYPLMHHVEFFLVDAGNHVIRHEVGSVLRPFAEREFLHRNFIFTVPPIADSGAKLMMRFETSGALHVPVRVFDQKSLIYKITLEYILFGIYFGAAAILIIYNLTVFLAMRDRAIGWYVVYLGVLVFTLSSLYGISYQFAWPTHERINEPSLVFFVGLLNVTMPIFAEKFFTRANLSRLGVVALRLVSLGGLMLSLGAILSYGPVVIRCTGLLAAVGPVVVLITALSTAPKRVPGTIWFILGVGSFMLGSIGYGLRDLGLFRSFGLIEFNPLFGSLIEMVVLSFGLNTKIRAIRVKAERETLQRTEAELSLARVEAQASLKQAQFKLASQVAHDIRSPLAALGALSQDMGSVAEQNRVLLRAAVNRIEDIANDLLNTRGNPNSQSRAPASHFIISIVESMVTEKRMQYRTRDNLKISANFDKNSYGVFVDIPSADLSRILSNLLNNAAEAVDENVGQPGEVSIAVRGQDSQVLIEIFDNGKGMDEATLAIVGQAGMTHKKAGGNGLGVFHAKTTLATYGGSLEYESRVGGGTLARIRLPKAISPAWFVPSIDLGSKLTVLVVDDDNSVFEVWKQRLATAIAPPHNLKVEWIASPQALRSRLGQIDTDSTQIFMDQDLRDANESGLDLIKNLGLSKISMLVTSRYDERQVRDECLSLGLGLLPKNLVSLVPISDSSLQTKHDAFDAVLLDDDPLVHAIWQLSARRNARTLKSFESAHAFAGDLERIPKHTPIYVDVQLDNGVSGIDLARDLAAKGYTAVWLATGHDPRDISAPAGVRGVLGKAPRI